MLYEGVKELQKGQKQQKGGGGGTSAEEEDIVVKVSELRAQVNVKVSLEYFLFFNCFFFQIILFSVKKFDKRSNWLRNYQNPEQIYISSFVMKFSQRQV